ncbi:MAG TPA: sulfurtransferase-like selenium metabolism protein YedF [Anaeromyxobacteraceae bacterium]|nr:sulfurtransferase-like selenium metabolism protein YedF [Anaeromyxobacteraceae bacterium]
MAGTVILLNAETMGRGDDALGSKIMGSFLRTLAASPDKPETIVFYNAAVKLLASDSSLLDALRALDDGGVELLACVTCLEFYGLTERLAVGHVSNMREIVQRMSAATKVVTI